MKKKAFLVFVAVTIGLSLLNLPAGWAQPPSPAPQVAEVQIHSGDTIKSMLERMTGKDATLTLAGGGELTGVVTKVENQLVHLSKLRGKEFFDAVVRLDSIIAVTVRVKVK